jgi:hypothetical protein
MSLQVHGHRHDRHEPLLHFPLRYWMSSSKALTAQIYMIIHTAISQYYLNQAVKRGVARQQVQPGAVTFIQRFGGAINLNVHFHVVFLEGVSLDRTEAGLKPRFVKGEPPAMLMRTPSHSAWPLRSGPDRKCDA